MGMISEIRSGAPSAVTRDVEAGPSEFPLVEIKQRMSGNLCRCGGYVGIAEAIRKVFEEMVP
jgi:xanthine dehydrogenase YagT iron-sulfur-binding subunit